MPFGEETDTRVDTVRDPSDDISWMRCRSGLGIKHLTFALAAAR
jgi:hypothetical protein